MKYVHYMPKNLKLFAHTIFGVPLYRSFSGRIYEVSDDYIISYNKLEFVL